MLPKPPIDSASDLPGETNPGRVRSGPVVPDHGLIRRIGAGAYGEVWLARNVFGAYRAVKVVYRSSFREERAYEREFRGIQSYEPISRSNDGLLDILQAGRNDAAGYYYYVMELGDAAEPASSDASDQHAASSNQFSAKAGTSHAGSLNTDDWSPNSSYSPKTLHSEIQRRGRLPSSECVELGLHLTLALGHLHRHGLIHRDIKPANIIFIQGIPKLADIGLVTAFDDTCSFVGTEGFVPPEGPTSPRADIFSLGKVFYEISTGKDRKDFPEPPTGLGEQEDELLEELNAVILKACALKAEERYQSAEEFHADLALLHSGESVKWKRRVQERFKWAKKTLAVVALIAAFATGGYFLQRQQTREARRNLYVANLNLAQRDWDKANIERLSQLLKETETYPAKGFEWYYWQSQLHLELKTLRGHSNVVNSVAFSPDGQRLVTGGSDHTAMVWDWSRGLPLILLKGHTAPVKSVAFMPDGKRIVTGGNDRTVRIWDVSDGRQIAVLAGFAGSVFAVAVSPDGQRIATASRISDRRAQIGISLWDAISHHKLRDLTDKPGGHGVSAVSFSRDGERIAAITDRFAVKVWETASGRELSTCKAPNHEFYSVALSPDGERIVTGSSETIVWNATTGEQLFVLQNGTKRGVWAVAYSPDGKQIVTAGGDQRVIVWDAENGLERFRLAGHGDRIGAVAISPDGKRIVTGSNDATVRIWDAEQLPNPRNFPTRSRETTALTFSPDGARIASAGDKTMRIMDTATGNEVLVSTGHVDAVTYIAFSSDSRRIVLGIGRVGSRNQRTKILEAATGRELLAVDGGLIAFSRDGSRIATASGAHATIRDASNGQPIITLNGPADSVRCGAFSPDGQRLAMICRARRDASTNDSTTRLSAKPTVRIWDVGTGREMFAFECDSPGNEPPSFIMFSPDGKYIALAGNDRTAQVRNASTGRELLVLRGHVGMVACLAFSPDGRRIVTASEDRSAKVWDAFTGRELLTLEGHTRVVRAIAFSPDGGNLATAGNDSVIKIWNAASPKQVAAWQSQEREANVIR